MRPAFFGAGVGQALDHGSQRGAGRVRVAACDAAWQRTAAQVQAGGAAPVLHVHAPQPRGAAGEDRRSMEIAMLPKVEAGQFEHG